MKRTAVFIISVFVLSVSMPKSNKEYWIKKLTNNRNRNLMYYAQMRDLGLRVIVVWECQIDDACLEVSAEMIIEGKG